MATTSQAEQDLSTPPSSGEATQTNSTLSAPPPPALPPDPTVESDDSRNLPKPEVTIIHKEDARIEEYRVNGRLRYVKIIPKNGKPYYFVDRDGDGQLETRHDDLDGVPPIQQWILLEW